MKLPVGKNKRWISRLHKGIAGLNQQQQAEIMKPCGRGCAEDILLLCEKILGRKVTSIEDLIEGWNIRRDELGLHGKWVFEGSTIRGVFKECGCPLVASGLVDLHPVQCLCSQGMVETIFAKVAGRPVEVEIAETIGRGGKACHFIVRQ